MASFEFKIGEEYAVKLSRYAAKSDEIAKKAIYTGAGMVADEIRKNIEALPEDEFRHLNTGETFKGIPKEQKIDILHGLGVTPIDVDRDGNHNAKIGFDGYGSMKTKKYPKGVPNALIARATESGSSVRNKTPFVRPAIKTIKKNAINAMEQVVDEETKKIMK